MNEVDKKAELLLHKWKTELKSKDRSQSNVGPNFDELIDVWDRSDIPFDTAFDLFKGAVRAHYPSDSCIRSVYKRLKPVMKKSEQEFKEDWLSNIESTAYQSFYAVYDLDVPIKPKMNTGSMSEKEYRLQRAHADSYPEIDLDTIDHRLYIGEMEDL